MFCPDEALTYVPDGGPGRVDIFEYSVSDGKGGSDIAQVTVDLDLLFYDGFEQGDAVLWDVSAGSCNPDGSFTGPDSWNGTYTMEFVGPDCATCTLLDPLNPCIDQLVPVSASRR